jgi:hypothetical protein
MGSTDLIDFQVGSRKFPIFQVGRGKAVRLFERLKDSGVSSSQQGVLRGEDSCGFADHVNEDDDKSKTCPIQKEDQKSILMIRGIKLFLPYSPVEASMCVSNATTMEGQPTVTVKDMEKMSEDTQGKEEEHTVKMITPWEKELEMLEDWLKNPEPVDDC